VALHWIFFEKLLEIFLSAVVGKKTLVSSTRMMSEISYIACHSLNDKVRGEEMSDIHNKKDVTKETQSTEQPGGQSRSISDFIRRRKDTTTENSDKNKINISDFIQNRYKEIKQVSRIERLRIVEKENTRENIRLELINNKGKTVGMLHAAHQQNENLKHREKIGLKTFNFQTRHEARALMKGYKDFVRKRETEIETTTPEIKNTRAEIGTITRRYTRVDVTNQKLEKFLKEDGWHPAQEVRYMNKSFQASLWKELETYDYHKHSPYQVEEAKSFEEVKGLMQALHTHNARFNPKFTVSEKGMDTFRKMYEDTTSKGEGLWMVLKDEKGESAGLSVLIGNKKEVEVEAFFLNKDLRTKRGAADTLGQERPSATLMKEGLRRAKKQLGLDEETDINLYVTSGNKIAQNFYKKRFGFEIKTQLWDLGGEPRSVSSQG
jgi:hypothetical protein